MANSNKKASGDAGAPKVSRPKIPAEYGVPKDNKGLLPWSYVSEQMEQARVYWVATVDPDCHPHATPVDGVWLDDRLYFGGSLETRRHRNLVRNSGACVHLESGNEVVILYGEVEELGPEDREVAQRMSDMSKAKYGYEFKVEDYLTGGTFAFKPHKVIAWKASFKDATRWEF